MVTNLIQAGADLNAMEDSIGTPLHAALLFGRASTVQLLLAAGADPCIPHRILGFTTPLEYAVNCRDAIIAGLLIEALHQAGVVSVDTPDRRGYIALHTAAGRGCTHTILLLQGSLYCCS
jgi:ankyrin repeat protein